MSRVATLDIGSNTILLLIADDAGGELTSIVDECRFARLGQGLAQASALRPDAIERGVAALREYAARIAEHDVDVVAAVGTQALREADNAFEFLGPARELLGVEVEVIDGSREAELVARAVTESFSELADGNILTADVGGGSTELTLIRGGETASVTSVPIGAVRLTERHLHSDPPTPEEITGLFADIDDVLGEVELPSDATVVGTAGTATSLASIEQKLLDYDPKRVHGFRISSAVVDRLLARLLELSVAEKKRLRGLSPERADVIAAGAAIYARLLNRLGAEGMTISDRGVRWGLAYEVLASAAS